MERKRIPVIIDTDLGDDIDDAFALCLAMKAPELEILGVTTVFKNTLCRAKIVRKMLNLGGFEHVPVYAGASLPLATRKVHNIKVDFTEKPISYTEELDNEYIDITIDGPEFIIRTLDQSEKPIVIVTLGALTNIAEVIRRRPDICKKIEYISIMGGSFFQNRCEFNFACDPVAADVVFLSGIKIQATGLDVTFQCKLSEEQLKQLDNCSHPVIKMLMDMRQSWGHDVFLHDPLALTTVFDNSFLEFKEMRYRVETQGKFTSGSVLNVEEYSLPHIESTLPIKVAVSVKAQEFTKMCVESLLSFAKE